MLSNTYHGVSEMKRINLKIAMVEKNLTGRELARMLGVSESIVSLTVNGKYNLSPQQQEQVSDILEKPAKHLFS